jgi:hypothetical protein
MAATWPCATSTQRRRDAKFSIFSIPHSPFSILHSPPEEVWALKAVNFEIRRGETVGTGFHPELTGQENVCQNVLY